MSFVFRAMSLALGQTVYNLTFADLILFFWLVYGSFVLDDQGLLKSLLGIPTSQGMYLFACQSVFL